MQAVRSLVELHHKSQMRQRHCEQALPAATADVVVLGWRLGILADKLRANDLATVHVLPNRFGDLDRSKSFVSSITGMPIAKG